MARPAHTLRAVFEAALLDHIKKHGDNFERSALVQDFVDRGVSQSTCYRWVDAILTRGRVQRRQPAISPVVAHVALPADPAVEIAAKLPAVPSADDVATLGLLPVLQLLRESIEIAQDLIKHSRGSDGKVRNARLMLAGSEHLRRAVETAAKLNDTVAAQQEMQQFHRVVLEEVGLEAPALQERILRRIRRACDAVLST